MIVRVYGQDSFEVLDSLFILLSHGQSNAEPVESRDVVREKFQNFLVERDSLVPVLTDGGFNGVLLKVVRVVIVHSEK